MDRKQWITDPKRPTKVCLYRYYTIVCRARCRSKAGQGGYRERASRRKAGKPNKPRQTHGTAVIHDHSRRLPAGLCLRNRTNAPESLGISAKRNTGSWQQRPKPVSFAYREATYVV
ncbi:unnamed protein product [Ectocarpus sp. 4 AP-2014]